MNNVYINGKYYGRTVLNMLVIQSICACVQTRKWSSIFSSFPYKILCFKILNRKFSLTVSHIAPYQCHQYDYYFLVIFLLISHRTVPQKFNRTLVALSHDVLKNVSKYYTTFYPYQLKLALLHAIFHAIFSPSSLGNSNLSHPDLKIQNNNR